MIWENRLGDDMEDRWRKLLRNVKRWDIRKMFRSCVGGRLFKRCDEVGDIGCVKGELLGDIDMERLGVGDRDDVRK